MTAGSSGARGSSRGGWGRCRRATHLGDGTIRYEPKAGLHGTDSFTYTVESPGGDRETATVTVTVVEVVPPAAVADFDGDSTTDVGVYRSVQGRWDVLGQFGNLRHGQSGDVPLPADYAGDGTAELAVFRVRNGRWLVMGQPDTSWGSQSRSVPLSAPLHLMAGVGEAAPQGHGAPSGRQR